MQGSEKTARSHVRSGTPIPPTEELLSLLAKDVGQQLRDHDADMRAQFVSEASQRRSGASRHRKAQSRVCEPHQFFEDFISFTARVRQIEGWQDELSPNFKNKANGLREKYNPSAQPDVRLDIFKREEGGNPASGKAKKASRITRLRASKSPAMSQVLVSSELPRRLQNMFQSPNDMPRGLSRVETDLLTIQTYAPNWLPKQRDPKVKKRKGSSGRPGDANFRTKAAERWELGETGNSSQSCSAVFEGISTLADNYIFPSNETERNFVQRPRSDKGVERSALQTMPMESIRGIKKLRKKKMSGSTSAERLEVLPHAQSAAQPTIKHTPYSAIPCDLTAEETQAFKNLPRPRSAMDNTGLMHAAMFRPSTARASSLDESGGDSVLALGSRRKLGENVCFKRLRPKLATRDLSDRSSYTGKTFKALSCPECFNAFGGVCILHVDTTWKGSLKQALIDEDIKRVNSVLSGDFASNLRVKLFTSTQAESRGKVASYEIEPDDTLQSLKLRICEDHGTPTMFQRFVFRGHYLKDDQQTMQACGIDNGMTLFVVLEPPSQGNTVASGCEYCAMALGGVCTRHLRAKRGDIYPRQLRDSFLNDKQHRAARADRNLRDMAEEVDESRLRRGKIIIQQFRLEMLKRFNSVFDAWVYFDMDGDGSITMKEFVALCRPLRLPKNLMVELVFQEIDAKEELMKLFPFSFVRATIWHNSLYNLKVKSDIYQGVDASRVNHREICRLAQERSSLPTTIYAGINDVHRPASPAKSEGRSSACLSRPLSAMSTARGCPLCDKAINGQCHRCLPVYKNGQPVMSHTNADNKYKEALQQADESKNLALTSTTPSAFFELDGIECGKGTKVSVMFDNDQWHTGILDAYNTRTTKVRIIFPDPKIGVIHASMGSLLIKVTDSEQGVYTTPTQPDIRLNMHKSNRCDGIDPFGIGCAVGLNEECDDSRDKEVWNSLSDLQVRIPQAKSELACELSHKIDTGNHILPSREDLHSHDDPSIIEIESTSKTDAGHDRVGDQRSLRSVSPVSQLPLSPSTPLDSEPED